MKVRTIYLIREADKNGAAIKPRVSIERTASGAIVGSVHVSARSLKQARETAQAEFTKLMRFARNHIGGKNG